jgi:hypothetical protein
MNPTQKRATLLAGLLAVALAAAPAGAEDYELVVEPIAEGHSETQAPDAEGFSQAELDQMLAPIALHPDALLSHILIAATYPLEVVEAARWSRANPQLQGDEAVEAVAGMEWDPSVKALVAFPEILQQMDEELDWTQRLGDAMLYQEAQVMDSIQFLRARADAAGHLASNEYTRVIREEKTIIIEPARTTIVHVPYYDPWVVYGSWWWPAYAPVVWAPPRHYYYAYPGFYWSSGVYFSSGFFYTNFYWPTRSVIVVRAPSYYYGYPRYWRPGHKWRHNPVHRRGVAYRHPHVRERYASSPAPRWADAARDLASGSTANRDDGRWTAGARRGAASPDGRTSWREGTAAVNDSWRARREAPRVRDEDRRPRGNAAPGSEPRFAGSAPVTRARPQRPEGGAPALERRLGALGGERPAAGNAFSGRGDRPRAVDGTPAVRATERRTESRTEDHPRAATRSTIRSSGARQPERNAQRVASQLRSGAHTDSAPVTRAPSGSRPSTRPSAESRAPSRATAPATQSRASARANPPAAQSPGAPSRSAAPPPSAPQQPRASSRGSSPRESRPAAAARESRADPQPKSNSGSGNRAGRFRRQAD